MDAVHIHLLLNHFPIVGMVLGFLLFVVGMFLGNTETKRAALMLYVVVALLSIPVYLTGEPSEDKVEHLAGTSESMIEEHEEIAGVSLGAIIVLGIASAGTLVLFRKASSLPGWTVLGILVLSIATTILMSWTGYYGGQIRHPEVRSDAQASPHYEMQDDD